MSAETDIAERFARDTAKHQMTVLQDDGLYRHLQFMNPKNSEYWFELITWPECLVMRGDVGDGYVFNRMDDMFQFFRSDRQWGINSHYWAEKLGGGRRSVEEYSEATFRKVVCELFVSAVRYDDTPRGLGKAVRAEILNQDLSDEREACELLESFEYKKFEFGETWEFSFRDYKPDFLWACHAIAWGIGQYDAAKTPAVAA